MCVLHSTEQEVTVTYFEHEKSGEDNSASQVGLCVCVCAYTQEMKGSPC